MIMSGFLIVFWGLVVFYWKLGYNIVEYCDRELCFRNRDLWDFWDYLMKFFWEMFIKYEVMFIFIDVSDGV